MPLNDDIHVLPREPVLPTRFDVTGVKQPEVDASVFLGLIVVLSLIAFVALQPIAAFNALSIDQARSVHLKIEALALFIACVVYFYWKSQEKKAYERKVDEALKVLEATRREGSIAEALALTVRVRGAVTSYQKNLDTLPRLLSQAEQHLHKAEQEYQDGAYEPFWDNVVSAARALIKFNVFITKTQDLANEINKSIVGRSHNFPELAPPLLEIPEPRRVVDELARLLRLGQTNFEFAMILAQRRAREVHFEGATLDDAVDGLGQALNLAVNDLKDKLAPNLGRGSTADG